MTNEELENTSEIRGYTDLLVWQRAMELAEEVYRLAAMLPDIERYGLAPQIRKATISIPSNIAEGHSRQTTGHYRHHLQIARGSTAEVQTQLQLMVRLHQIPQSNIAKAMSLSEECMRMLATLINRLRQ